MIKFKNENPVRNRERMPYFADLINDLFDTTITPDFRRTTVPGVNISETDEMYKLEMAAPGLEKDDFKINIENDVLSVSAEKKSESTENNDKITRREYSYSSFNRSFTLPEMVDTDKIAASYNNGIMKIELPKKEEAKPKTPKEIKVS